MKEILSHTFEDSLKLLPFLFVTYLLLEFIERKASGKTAHLVAKAGKAGPLIGALLGAFPQCGFSAALSNFYAAGLVDMGTLIAVFMSTSDEMIPVLLAERVPSGTIARILLFKILAAAVSGFVVSFLFRRVFSKSEADFETYRKEHAHDCSEAGHRVVTEALIRTLQTFAFVFAVTFAVETLIHSGGRDLLESFLTQKPALGVMLSALVGMIPNCGASVIITQLYIEDVIGSGAMISGLLVSAGVGLLVLFKENHNVRENLTILGVLYVLGVLWGFACMGMGISF